MANDSIQLELNKPYTQTALAKVLGISNRTLIRSKQKQLNNLSLYYKFNVESIGTSLIYTFTEQIGEYKRPLTAKTQQHNETISNLIIDIVKKDNIQTSANIVRVMLQDKKEEVNNLNLSKNTLYIYTTKISKTLFGTLASPGSTGIIFDRVLCKLDKENNKYIPLPPDQEKELFTLYEKEKEPIKKEIYEIEDALEESKTKEEAAQKIGQTKISAYIRAKQNFYKKYGYYPVYAYIYYFKEENKFAATPLNNS